MSTLLYEVDDETGDIFYIKDTSNNRLLEQTFDNHENLHEHGLMACGGGGGGGGGGGA